MQSKRRMNMKKALQEIFPVELKQYRIKRELTQEAMARLLMVSVRSYIDMEHGVYKGIAGHCNHQNADDPKTPNQYFFHLITIYS